MLLILFQIGNDRFGLDVEQVLEVVPVVTFKKAPHTPGYVAGMFNYRGTIVPVIDLSTLISGEPSKSFLSTRILLVNYNSPDDTAHVLGLLAERVTETFSCNEDDFQPPGIESENAKYLENIILDDKGMIQFVSVEKILPESLHEILFKKSGMRSKKRRKIKKAY